MSEYLTLRMVAPVACLQGPRIDGLAETLPIPTRSMIAGIIGAALGIAYYQPDRMQAVQDALRMGVVVHRPGDAETDYQTVDMGQPHMVGPMWWHDGARLGVMERTGLDQLRTLITQRPLLCDIDMTIIVELMPGAPHSAAEILAALDRPAHQLGIGQRVCVPTQRIAGVEIEAASLEEAIAQAGEGVRYMPAEAAPASWGDLYVSVPAGRTWTTREHGGTDTYVVGHL